MTVPKFTDHKRERFSLSKGNFLYHLSTTSLRGLTFPGWLSWPIMLDSYWDKQSIFTRSRKILHLNADWRRRIGAWQMEETLFKVNPDCPTPHGPSQMVPLSRPTFSSEVELPVRWQRMGTDFSLILPSSVLRTRGTIPGTIPLKGKFFLCFSKNHSPILWHPSTLLFFLIQISPSDRTRILSYKPFTALISF